MRSDVERKRLFGVPETQRLERQHYRIGTAQRVYSIVEDKARRALAAGQAVIVDAVFAKQDERAAVEAIAREAGCAFVGLWLTAPAETLIARVERRRGDASDADRRVVREQLGYDLGDIAWQQVDASGTPGAQPSRSTSARSPRRRSQRRDEHGRARQLAGAQARDRVVGIGKVEGRHVRADRHARRELQELDGVLARQVCDRAHDALTP